jgi:hypothetical protein
MVKCTLRVVKGRLVSLPENIGLGWMLTTLTDTLAYYDTKLIAAITCFYTSEGSLFNHGKVHSQSG